MCGITGCVDFSGENSEMAVTAMTAALVHRGPDAGKVDKFDAFTVFGHRRLSIIDLSENASQPMRDPSGRYVMVYNGEVYNYKELRATLQKKGHKFHSLSDTEVVLKSFMEWGTGCFQRFNGMFALAIWDGLKRECLLARDRLGQKPLCYSTKNGRLIFASELTALLADPNILSEATPSIEALNHYLAMGYILSPCTFLDDVWKLEPAQWLRFGERGILEKGYYWDYLSCFHKSTIRNQEALSEELHGLIEDAVRLRLIADVPVGSFLSGGVDSSGIASLAQSMAGYKIKTFTASFSSTSYDEGPAAAALASLLGTEHHVAYLDNNGGRQILNNSIACFDEPFSDTSLIPMVELAKLTGQHVKVVLSGDGADELFGGYATYTADRIMRAASYIPAPVRRAAAAALRHFPQNSQRKVGFGFKVRQFSGGLNKDWRHAHYSWRELFNEDERIGILGQEHAEQIRDTHPFKRFSRHYKDAAGLDQLSQHLYVDVKTWLADDILVKVDRATMAASLEARCPYLDYRIVEFAATIPPELKRNKIILRKALQGILPAQTAHRKKTGFNAPVAAWLGTNNENEFRSFNRLVFSKWALCGLNSVPGKPSPGQNFAIPSKHNSTKTSVI